MRITPYTRIAPMAVALGVALSGAFSLACGADPPPADPPPADAAGPAPHDRFAGAWSLTRTERRDADGALLAPPTEDRVGYLIYDPAGYMGVTLMRPGRTPYAGDQPTAEEALALLGSYSSYFGRFTVNADEGYVTHHLEGSLNPGGAGSDYRRHYTFGDDTLTLQPPAAADGSRSFITWTRLPDLPAADLTATHRQLFGVYRVESVSRATTGGEPVAAEQYDTAYILYAPSGHMSVHLMRPGRTPYAGDRPTADEALAATRSYGSYFGPFSVHEEDGYLVHHRVGSEDPGGSGTDAQRFFELTATHLTLRPPVQTDDDGRDVQSTIRWARLGG